MNTQALRLQQLLQPRKSISVPQLQIELELPYVAARELIGRMAWSGWISAYPRGICYRVLHRNLNLRDFPREEARKVFPELVADDARALKALLDFPGADFEAVEQEVQGNEDTGRALERLQKLELICCRGQRYFLRIVPDAAAMLIEIHEAMPVALRVFKRESQMQTWKKEAEQIIDKYYGDL